VFALVVRVFNTENGIETDSIAASDTYYCVHKHCNDRRIK